MKTRLRRAGGHGGGIGRLSVRFILGLALALPLRPEAGNLLQRGDFEGAELISGAAPAQPGVWIAYVPRDSRGAFSLDPEGHKGICARYKNSGPGSHNLHLDQLFEVQPQTIYELRAWVRADTNLRPLCSISTMAWKPLAAVALVPDGSWQETRLVFDSHTNTRLRLEWFGGAEGRRYTGVAGISRLDDVSLRPLASVPAALAHALTWSKPANDERLTPATGQDPIGSPLPLRPMRVSNGVLQYVDGGEVALWGLNFQTALSWEHVVRLAYVGIPATAEALKRVTEVNFEHLKYLGAGIIRLHLLPADFSDGEGQIVDSVYLDILDFILAKCHERGIYAYLTLVNEMNTAFLPGSFMAGRKDRKEWFFDEHLTTQMRRYLRGMLERRNRYTGRVYAQDPALAVIELVNEPEYPDPAALGSNPRLARARERFDAWCREQGVAAWPASAFPAWRYEQLRAWLQETVATVRATGARQPIAWNLNWPRFIAGQEDVFQAVADSPIDAISFCLYPGQDDCPSPFWKYPSTNLGGKNFLPFLRQQGEEYERLGWALGKRFAGQAKLVYEFETFYNQSAYLYPAMAALFRSLGVQAAMMWNYGLSPLAEYAGGTHYLNLECTPRKALSFRVASHVFYDTARYQPLPADTGGEWVAERWAVSFPRDLSAFCDGQRLAHAGPLADWPFRTLPAGLASLCGIGSSPRVSYEGSGAWFLELSPAGGDLVIFPDVVMRSPFERIEKSSPTIKVELHSERTHPFTLRDFRLKSAARVEGDAVTPVPLHGQAFDVRAGQYRLEPQR